MNRFKKEQRKVANQREAELANLTPESRRKAILQDKFEQLRINMSRNLCLKLFPEDYDMIYDSIADAELRRSGGNPMNEEYTHRMNMKRKALGVKPLYGQNDYNGITTNEFCQNLVEQQLNDEMLLELFEVDF